MIFFAIFLLITAFMSTGTTREQIYKRESARRGGECFGVTAMICSYLLNIVWMFVLAITAILSACYVLFSRLCGTLTAYNDANCLDFTLLKPLLKDYTKNVSAGAVSRMFHPSRTWCCAAGVRNSSARPPTASCSGTLSASSAP